ncbi:hypothetical protein RF11_04977 [Thelohanellus kitauei]|uniref:Uncharacterized protein n=1 Tax=Thelohanellus kitauei TaxID=669202 RepID=A0A0C2N508_THEKT|nr:hypothetical protein RF11_04977 [Thelohanellus kitauei]
MNRFDFEESTLIIKFEEYSEQTLWSYLEIKCNLVDRTEYIEISQCNISARTEDKKSEHHHFFDNEWKMEKKTQYEIENLKKTFNIDQDGSKYLRFIITNITIEPQMLHSNMPLKQITMGINENDFTCVNILPLIDSSKTNKLWWYLIILIVPVTIILAM